MSTILSRRGFLGIILGSATATMVPDTSWLWEPAKADMLTSGLIKPPPPIPDMALVSIDRVLQALVEEIDAQLNQPGRHYCAPSLRGRLHSENLVLPTTVSEGGPDRALFAVTARSFVELIRDGSRRSDRHYLRRPLDVLGNDLHEAHAVSPHCGVHYRAIVYPDQRVFALPANQFAVRFDVRRG